MTFRETSAIDNVNVEDCFIEMARAALKRDAQQQISLPPSVGSSGSTLRLNAKSTDY